MTPHPQAIDLFCCQGGASAGLVRAGFSVLGVDIDPQPRYPYAFHQGDALTFDIPEGVEFVWASPPCQFATALRHAPNAKQNHPNLIPAARAKLEAWAARTGGLWCIENVEEARSHLRDPLLLCGSMFAQGTRTSDGTWFDLHRHRLFETNFDIPAPAHEHTDDPVIGIYGGHVRCRSSKFWRSTGADFPGENKKQLAIDALGLGPEHDKVTMDGLSQMIPPAFSCFIATHARLAMRRKATQAA